MHNREEGALNREESTNGQIKVLFACGGQGFVRLGLTLPTSLLTQNTTQKHSPKTHQVPALSSPKTQPKNTTQKHSTKQASRKKRLHGYKVLSIGPGAPGTLRLGHGRMVQGGRRSSKLRDQTGGLAAIRSQTVRTL